jgi:Flp pilus assembly pilin Flp
MTAFRKHIRNRFRFETDESGQGLAEYALILAFVAAICVAAVGTLGNAIASSPGFSLI